MNAYSKLQAVAVMHAAFVLIFSIGQAVFPGFNFIDEWFHSRLIQVVVFAAFWLMSPLLIKLTARKDKED